MRVAMAMTYFAGTVQWKISGDTEKARRELTGLALKWLHVARDAKHLGNFGYFDTGWKRYPQGNIRVVSNLGTDTVYMNAIGGGEVEKKKIYNTPIILAYKVQDESRINEFGNPMEGWIKANEETLEPQGKFIDIGYPAHVDHYGYREDGTWGPFYSEGTNYVERCSGTNSKGQPNCIEEFPFYSGSISAGADPQTYTDISPESQPTTYSDPGVCCQDSFFQTTDRTFFSGQYSIYHDIQYKGSYDQDERVYNSEKYSLLHWKVNANVSPISCGTHTYHLTGSPCTSDICNTLNTVFTGSGFITATCHSLNGSSLYLQRWYGTPGISIHSRINPDNYILMLYYRKETNGNDYSIVYDMRDTHNGCSIMGCTLSSYCHSSVLHGQTDRDLSAEWRLVLNGDESLFESVTDIVGSSTSTGSIHPGCNNCKAVGVGPDALYQTGDFYVDYASPSFSIGQQGYQYLKMLEGDDYEPYPNTWMVSKKGEEKLLNAKEVALFNIGITDTVRKGESSSRRYAVEPCDEDGGYSWVVTETPYPEEVETDRTWTYYKWDDKYGLVSKAYPFEHDILGYKTMKRMAYIQLREQEMEGVNVTV